MNKKKVYGWIKSIIIALIIALFIRQFIIEAFVIPSGSMEPTLLVGDHILVNKFVYGIRMPFTNETIIPISHPKVGDVVVFKWPVKPGIDFIKRTMGTPGDVLQMINKQLYINGKPYHCRWCVYRSDYICPKDTSSEPCKAKFGSRDNWGPIVVPKNEYFMMGDNRDNSYDSRYWGFVPNKDIVGQAFIIYGSWELSPFEIKWNRFFKLIPQ